MASKNHTNHSDRGMTLEGDEDSNPDKAPQPVVDTAGDADRKEGELVPTADKKMTQSKDQFYKEMMKKGFKITDEVLNKENLLSKEVMVFKTPAVGYSPNFGIAMSGVKAKLLVVIFPLDKEQLQMNIYDLHSQNTIIKQEILSNT